MIDKNAEKQKAGKRMNLINIEHISKIYGEKVIFDDASFGIQESLVFSRGIRSGLLGLTEPESQLF